MVHGLDVIDFHPLHALEASHVDQETTHHWLPPEPQRAH